MAYRYVDKVYPFNLSPASLDWYLARGWYRMGSNIFTTHFLCFQQEMYSAIWIRLDLREFKFSKSQRKLMRRNAQRFHSSVDRRHFSLEKEMLYTNYARHFDGRLSPSLRDNLEEYDENGVFNTYEVVIRERETNQLVGASYFDLGQAASASILGIYEPDFERYSLGYYSMLLEVEYCLQAGFTYYYPGYVVPGYHRFDYKKRIGSTDYLDVRTDSWLPLADFKPEEGPVERQREELTRLQSLLPSSVVRSEILLYPLFEARLYHIWHSNYLSAPFVLLLGDRPEPGTRCLVAVFDPHLETYQLLRCHCLRELRYLFSEQYLNSFPNDRFLIALLEQEQLLLENQDADRFAKQLLELLKTKK
ncbi:MAG: arginine-tRNA-protein transferase [Bacteroidota bacterium]